MFATTIPRPVAKKLRPLLAITAAAAVISAASCSAIPGPAAAEGGDSVRDLRLRWAQWRAVGPGSYSYELRRNCFCTPEAVTPARVEVRDGRVVDARAVATGHALPIALFEPIDSLFARAIEAAERGGPVDARYDARLGYPTWLEVGTLANDAGVRYEVSNLVALR